MEHNDTTGAPPDPTGRPASSPAWAPLPSAAATDVLGSFDDQPSKRRAPWLLVLGAAALVLVLVAGVTYAVSTLSGGGTHPDSALPSGAFAYAEVDLDPSADQKVDAFRFLRKFPAMAGKLSGDDVRKSLWDLVAEDAGWQNIDYAAEVEPWLGQRVGVGLYDPAKLGGAAGGDATEPAFLIALQVTDADRAKQGIATLAGASGGSLPGYAIEGEYALFAESQQIADRAAELARQGSLAQSPTYAADVSELEDGVATMWFDLAAAGKAASRLDPTGLGVAGGLGAVPGAAGLSGSGRAAYVVRFDGADTVEIAGRVNGVTQLADVGEATVHGLADLPADSALAVGLGGGKDLVDPMWKSLGEQLAGTGTSPEQLAEEVRQQTGLTLPADLKVLFGDNLLVTASPGAGQVPGFGVLGHTDPDAAAPLVEKLSMLAAQLSPDLAIRSTDEGYVMATSDALATALTDGSARTLGDRAEFRQALPDLDGARMAVWVDMEPLSRLATSAVGAGGPATDPNLAVIAGIGVTASFDGESGTFRARLVTE